MDLPSKELPFVMGSHTLEISNYLGAKRIGFANYIQSSPFTVGGHEWVIEFYPCGKTEQYKSDIALGVRLLDLTKRVRAFVNLMVLDLSTSIWSPGALSELQTFTPEENGWVKNPYWLASTFEASSCLKNNTLKIKCVLYVVVDNAPQLTEETPTDYVKQFSQYLENGVAADVKFSVKGKTFPAHRWVLAASSTVFKKLFFDAPIAKGEDQQIIIVENMETDTFKSLLYFIYTDSMPTEESDRSRASILMTQRLLAVADRYEINKLKSICEKKLCEDITIDTAAAMLVLAEEHNCSELRAVCIEFLFKNKI